VWLSTPSLVLFILGGAVTGAGGGAIFKGAVATVIGISPPEGRAGALAGTYLAAFVGLSLPIVGAGVALAEGVSPRVTVLAFAIAVAIGIAASSSKLLGSADRPVSRTGGRRRPRLRHAQ
jgi:MFS family permease